MTVTSEIVKVAERAALYVGFAEVQNGEVVYRDAIRANTITEAIAVRFGGVLPDGFIVEKVIRSR